MVSNINKKLLFIITITLLAKSSCRTAELGFKVMDLNGMIYDFTNRPVAHCEVILSKRFSRSFSSSTDINGRFTIAKIPYGTYTLTGYKKGFEIYTDEVTIKDRGQIIYFRVPSQNQLLSLVDEALTANDLSLAEELAERAYQIDNKNIEMLFYYAIVKYKQQDYQSALIFLETAKNLGSRDLYIDKFLSILLEVKNAEQHN